MKRSRFATGIACALGLGFALTLLWLLGIEPPVALTDSPHYVAPSCTGVPTPCYTTVQAAVDAAIPGDLIKVAAGTYSDFHVRSVPPDYPFPPLTGVVTQVVYITKTVTIQGGYTTANWTTPYPITQPTILDAKRKGRVLLIADNAAPTVEGLTITGGDAVGQSGYSRANYDTGGGVYIITSTPTLSNCLVFTNSAGYLGGLTDSAGGGVYVAAPASLYNNRILNNAATFGGGLFIENNHVTLTGNIIRSNFAVDRGGGLYIRYSDSRFVNSIIADNRANETGSAIYMRAATPNLFHTTLARNTGGDGAGVTVGDDYLNWSTAKFTNTIFVSHTVGITVSNYDNLGMYGVLWFDNDSNITTDLGTIKVTDEITGNPAFVNPDAGNYHLGVGSAAIDAGINAGVTTDLDGIARPQGSRPDLGAYEAAANLSIVKAGTGTGSVTSIPAGISCGVTCSFSFSLGTVVTLTAAPDAGSILTGWSGGGCSGRGTCVVTMNAAKSVTATFDINLAPIADAGPHQIVALGSTVILDGSDSYDPDYVLPLSYGWVQTGGSPAVTFTPNLSVTTFSAPSSATVLTFTLTVTDDLGLKSTPDVVRISVRRLIYLPLIQNNYTTP